MWAGRGSPVFVAPEGVDDPLRDELRIDDVAPAVLAGADIDVRGVAVGTGALAVAPAVRGLCPHEASANASAGVRTTPTARRFTSPIIRRGRATGDRDVVLVAVSSMAALRRAYPNTSSTPACSSNRCGRSYDADHSQRRNSWSGAQIDDASHPTAFAALIRTRRSARGYPGSA
jgi:hypothetical protein